jgi:hypothetical protein
MSTGRMVDLDKEDLGYWLSGRLVESGSVYTAIVNCYTEVADKIETWLVLSPFWTLNTMKVILAEKDTLGQPLFAQNPDSGILDLILGHSVILDEELDDGTILFFVPAVRSK